MAKRPMSLKQIIEQTDTVAGRAFDLFIQFLIVVSLISFSAETLPNLSATVQSVLRAVEVATVGIFTLEYLLRVVVADRRPRFVFSFFGLIDLAAILPFYLTTGLDLRALRAFRLLRLFRMFKLLRYSRAVRRIYRAFLLSREELILFFTTSCILIFLAGVGIYYFEHAAQPEAFASIFHSLWWAVATLTTVGYGDVYPVTVAGKLFTFVVLMIGLGIVAVPAGLVASALSEARRYDGDDDRNSLPPTTTT